MKLKDEALPIHRNAELKIRPRIFLEGNFFVDLKPGTPAAGEIDRGKPIPSTQTSAPVQLDQVLGTLKSDARKDLQDLLQGLGEGFGGQPQPDEAADDDPDTRGETAGQSLNDSLDNSAEALRGTAIVNEALLGRSARRPAQAHQGHAEGHGRPCEPREPAQGPGLELQHHSRRAGRRAERAAAHHPRPARAARAGQPGVRQAQRLVPVAAGLLAGADPGRARDAGVDHRRAAVDRPDPQAGVDAGARRADEGPRARRPRPRAPSPTVSCGSSRRPTW